MSNGNAKDDVRDWLIESLGVEPDDPVLERVWKLLEADDQIASAVQAVASQEKDWEEYEQKRLFAIASHLVKYAEAVKSVESGLSEKDSLPRRTSSKVSFASERARCSALGEYVALKLSHHPLVRKFRSEVLDGRPLSAEAAHRFVSSPAASRMSLDRLNRESIPVIEHAAAFYDHDNRFKRERLDRFIHIEYIDVDPPGKRIRTHLPVSVAYEDLPHLRFPEPEPAFKAERIFSESGVRKYPVYPRSVLDDLRNLSIRLTEISSDWTQAEAAWFVLTGEPVSVSAITAEYVERSSTQNLGVTISMTIEPWVSTEKVAKVYEYMRYRVLAKKPRAPENRNLKIFGFVSRRRRESISFGKLGMSDSMPTTDQLMDEWNQENPSLIYKKESIFKRDMKRGAKTVLLLSHDPDNMDLFFNSPLASIVVK